MKFVHFKYFLLVLSSVSCVESMAINTVKKNTLNKPSAANALLLEAAEKGDLKKAKEAITQGATNINVLNNDKWTPLMLAIRGGHLDVIKLLIDKGANPNIKGESGMTPLHIACAIRSEEIIKLLLDNGAQVNVANDFKWAPLHFAAEGGEGESFVRIVKLLLDKGADVNAVTNTGATSLLKAVHFSNNEEIVKLLISRGVDVNKQSNPDSFGNAPIHEAAIYSSQAMVKLLLDNGANVNVQITGKHNKGSTALHRAASTADVSLVKLLLDRGADPFIKDERGEIPLDFAKAEGYVIIHGEPENKVIARKKQFKEIVALLEQRMKTSKNKQSKIS